MYVWTLERTKDKAHITKNNLLWNMELSHNIYKKNVKHDENNRAVTS